MPRKTRIRPSSRRSTAGFNEAAARCRGKRADQGQPRPGRVGFNEAAARCRGKLHLAGVGRLDARASMRPRPDAAENGSILGFVRPGNALQ